MKRNLLVLSVLALGLSGIAQANPFPADGEADYSLQNSSAYAERSSGGSWTQQSAFPADGEAIVTVQARSSHLDKHAGDPVKERSEPMIAFVGLDD
jgi:hypothetical protein